MSLPSDRAWKVSPRLFSHACLGLAALVLLIVFPCLYCFYPAKVPREMVLFKSHCDFVQYYAGAEAVQHRIWDALYPTPRPDIYQQPSRFRPVLHTFLFQPDRIDGNLAFYPDIKIKPAVSEVSLKLLACFPQANTSWRYIYPPPAALLLWPLSWFSYGFAGTRIWPVASLWAYFMVAFFASRIHRRLRGSVSYTEGFIVLACLLFVYRGRTDIAPGNVTPFLSALISFAVYVLIEKRLFAFACALIPLFLFKTLGLTWLPLLLFHRAFWRVFLYLAALALLLNGMVLLLAGPGVYLKFFSLSPYVLVPGGVGLEARILRYFGFYPHLLYVILNLAGLAFIYYGYGRNFLPKFATRLVDDRPHTLAAALAGTMALYCLLNFNIWFTYCPNYLFFPFLGWILWEGQTSAGPWRSVILGSVCLAFFVLAGEWTVNGTFFYLGASHFAHWYQIVVFQSLDLVLIPALFLLVAYRRLYAFPQEKKSR